MDLAVIALTFAAIFVVELPDKTFIATLVLSTRYRPALVWVGVGLAFGCQVGIAVALGKAVSFLPVDWVRAGAALLFLVGAVILLREALGRDDEEDEDELAQKAGDVHGARVVLASFLVLFAAEWGDLSQLLTLSLVAKYDAPGSVFVGSWTALLTVSGLAVLAGRALLKVIPVHVLHGIGAAVCLVLAALTMRELLA
jgi:putative Ca2+/H+ antiporter (TMEM165/GDT1 family)